MKAKVFAMCVVTLMLVVASAAQLPPLSWTCPMHPDVLEAVKGRCAVCGMNLEPIRLVTVHTCAVHAVIEQAKPGKCKICGRELIPKTAALTFTCPGASSVSQMEPGKCQDGTPMIPRYTARAHGDHNPKHGGIFFMAPDNWHHLEGTYPVAGRFRVYVYDDFSRPLPPALARKVRGRVVTKEAFDPKTGTTRELASTPLVLARNGTFFEAKIERLALPAKMTAKISFSADAKESRFDFMFAGYSKPAASTSAPSSQNASVDKPASARSNSDELRRDKPEAELLTNLRAKKTEVDELVKSGTLAAIYFPALQAKDLALEIQARAAGMSADPDAVEASVKQIVQTAYQLDSFGDLGDGDKVAHAHRAFAAAIAQLDSLLSGRQ